MDASLPKLLESHFSPESGLISVEETTRQINDEQKASTLELEQRWVNISEDRKSGLKSECRRGFRIDDHKSFSDIQPASGT
jgi:hypothetical protein